MKRLGELLHGRPRQVFLILALLGLAYLLDPADRFLHFDSMNWRHYIVFKACRGNLTGLSKEDLFVILGQAYSSTDMNGIEHISYDLDYKAPLPDSNGYIIGLCNVMPRTVWDLELKANRVIKCSRSRIGEEYDHLERSLKTFFGAR